MKGGCTGVPLRTTEKKNHFKFNLQNKKSLPGYVPLIRSLHKSCFTILGAPRCICLKASITLEAVVVIPLVACLFAFCLFYFRVMQVEVCVMEALENTAQKLAVYAAADGMDEANDTTLYAMAKAGILLELKDNTYVNTFVAGDVLGISLLGTEFTEEEIFVKASYYMKFPVELFGEYRFLVQQQVCRRKWNGWTGETECIDNEEYVYITENGSVYHKTTECSYLDLQITSVRRMNISSYRNESGGIYYPCELCDEGKGDSQNVYITNYGDVYHSDLNCGGIKRTIYKVLLSEVSGKGACSKCWN